MSTKKQIVEAFRCRAISDAAMRAVARKGLAKTTVDDIARVTAKYVKPERLAVVNSC